jgi:hypothetical protein
MASRRGTPRPTGPSGSDDQAGGLEERKERVLHTRVPQSLDNQLKRRARNLGLSVSTVVRHVLLNTFGLVEDIVTDSTNVALSVAGEDPAADEQRRTRRTTRADDNGSAVVVGWQEAILNLNAVCDRCNAVLSKGTRAAIAVLDGPGRPTFLCKRCLGAVSGDAGRPSGRR